MIPQCGTKMGSQCGTLMVFLTKTPPWGGPKWERYVCSFWSCFFVTFFHFSGTFFGPSLAPGLVERQLVAESYGCMFCSPTNPPPVGPLPRCWLPASQVPKLLRSWVPGNFRFYGSSCLASCVLVCLAFGLLNHNWLHRCLASWLLDFNAPLLLALAFS